MDPTRRHRRVTRRTFIGTGGAAAVALAVAACSSDDSDHADPTSSTVDAGGTGSSATTGRPTDPGSGGSTGDSTGTPTTTVFTAAEFAALGTCLRSPEQTEGPYPTVDPIERRDLREGLDGHPLRLGLQVVDATCEPIPGALVEIWHCDVDGDYSEYADGGTDDDAAEGTTFLRGSQTTNVDGIVEFVTNYPGWYRGRAVHIHTKVHIDDTTVLTSQIFFADALNSEIFTEAPYVTNGDPDTTNEQDSIANGDPAGDGSQATAGVDAELSGTRALLVLGVDPAARSNGSMGGGPGAAGSSGRRPM